MRKGLDVWRRLGRVDKTFFVLLTLYCTFWATGAAPLGQALLGLAVVLAGLVALFGLVRRTVKGAIWRLRNRLIAAYVLIAVVPVVLILMLFGLAAYAVIGQMAVYLVNTELKQRGNAVLRQAAGLARNPMGQDPERGLSRFSDFMRDLFPEYEMRASGARELRYPPTSTLEHPPAGWPSRSRDLVLREVEVAPDPGDTATHREPRLFVWAYVNTNNERVTVIAPVTHDVLAGLAPGIGDVNFIPVRGPAVMGQQQRSHVPPAKNAFDFQIRGYIPVDVPYWESPEREPRGLLLVVDSRVSTVLGMVFQKGDWADKWLAVFAAVAVLFLVMELVSLFSGIRLSRTITGAVHELYEGTQHVKEADFSYRIPVNGNDQLAELCQSFNSMTENLGKLIVVAKEKERLESELAIAREVQNQLFPKDVPFTKTLELKGVCNPARMVSGDYYDFMALGENALAFAIGDVAGKGISAALLMATIQSTMRTQLSTVNGAGPAGLSTAKLVATLNRQLFATTAPEKYATFYFAIYDDATHALRYTNAGHLAPILVRGNDLSLLDSTGTVVGAFPIARYAEKTVALQQGDMLVAYTDGIVEPENAYGEMFGEERLKDLVVKYTKADSAEIIARTMEAVNQWTGAGELQDDMTMVVARRL
jgi:sigma-B regulation protein RsbU (phosphoserine phosphatase)